MSDDERRRIREITAELALVQNQVETLQASRSADQKRISDLEKVAAELRRIVNALTETVGGFAEP